MCSSDLVDNWKPEALVLQLQGGSLRLGETLKDPEKLSILDKIIRMAIKAKLPILDQEGNQVDYQQLKATNTRK